MIIANDIGPIPHAWLDGVTLDDSCRGMRFRLVVGDAGGIVCDVVTSRRELTTEQVERLATQAVVNTDPLDAPLPMVGDNGETARIVADPVHTEPVSRIVHQQLPDETAKPRDAWTVNPMSAIALVGGNLAALAGLAWIGIPVAIVGALTLVRRTTVATTWGSVAVDREMERRRRMPDMATAA